MKELIVKKCDDGITLNKYLQKIFINMPQGTYKKLLRKKYFEINNIKATGKEILTENDIISVYLSDETYEKFVKKKKTNDRVQHLEEHSITTNDKTKLISQNEKNDFYNKYIKNRIIYEDDNIIVYNKDVGILSQDNKKDSISVNKILNTYLNVNTTNVAFVPSVVHRLDRNTSGIIIFAKNYIAAKELSYMIKNDELEKHYIAAVNGRIDGSGKLIHILKKDEKKNKVVVKEFNGLVPPGYSKVELEYNVLVASDIASIVDINLITGKSHQIRAQFSYISHPLISDKKYMDIKLYKDNVEKFGSKEQILLSYKLKFGSFTDKSMTYLNNKTFELNSQLIREHLKNVNDYCKRYIK